MSFYYGTVTVASGTRSKAEVGTGGLSGVLIGNESGLTIKVTIDGTGSTKSLYPGYVDWFPIPSRGFNGNLLFDPVANLTNVSSWPSSYVQIDLFGLNEAPTGTYPVALPRLNNVGNTVSTALGSSTSLQNDNNAASTQIIEATQSGSPASNVFFDNSGNVTIREYQGGVNNILFQLIAGASTDVKLSFLNKFCEVLGGLIVDQTLQVTGATTLTGGATVGANGILAATATDLPINVDTGHTLFFRVNGGNILSLDSNGIHVPGILANTAVDLPINVDTGHTILFRINGGNVVSIDATGLNLSAKKINDLSSNNLADWSAGGLYLKGNPGNHAQMHYQSDGSNTDWTLAAMSTFTGTGSGTFSHNLKVAGVSTAPDFIIITTDVVGSQTVGYDTVTSTQVHITTGSTLAWKALAIKF